MCAVGVGRIYQQTFIDTYSIGNPQDSEWSNTSPSIDRKPLSDANREEARRMAVIEELPPHA